MYWNHYDSATSESECRLTLTWDVLKFSKVISCNLAETD